MQIKSRGIAHTSINAAALMERRKTVIARLNTLRGQWKAEAGATRDRAIRSTHRIYIHNGLTLDDVAGAVDRSPALICKHFKRLRLRSHPSSHRRAGHVPARSVALENPNAFEFIDTPKKAYLLGILFADAKPRIRVRARGDKEQKVYEGLEYIVGSRDVWVLERLKSLLGSAAPIKEVTATLTHRNQERRYTNRSLIVYSTRLSRDLEKLGLVPGRTTQNVALPKLQRELVRHFIRGLIDGDGWITRNDNVRDPLKGWGCGICGSLAVIACVMLYAEAHGLRAPTISRNGTNGLKVQWSGVQAIWMIELLYGPDDLALPRKKIVARAIVEAFHLAYPNGAERSIRYQMRDGKRYLYLTDEQRCETPSALQLALKAVKVWKRNMHPTRGRRSRGPSRRWTPSR